MMDEQNDGRTKRQLYTPPYSLQLAIFAEITCKTGVPSPSLAYKQYGLCMQFVQVFSQLNF